MRTMEKAKKPSNNGVAKINDDLRAVQTNSTPVKIADSAERDIAEAHELAFGQQTEGDPVKEGKEAQLDVLIVELTDRWSAHDKCSLELRHHTGARLNALLGSPNQRQEYGKQASERVAKAIHVATSEISRMRWFAHHFSSVEGLKEAHPTLQNWSEVKVILADMNSGRREKIHKPTSSFIRSLRVLTKKLHEGENFALEGDQRKDLQQAMQELRREIERKFGLSQGKPTGKPTEAKQSSKQSARQRKPNRAKKVQSLIKAPSKPIPAKVTVWQRMFGRPKVA